MNDQLIVTKLPSGFVRFCLGKFYIDMTAADAKDFSDQLTELLETNA